MRGRTLVLLLLGFALLFGAALWYFQTRFWYGGWPDPGRIAVMGREVAVADWQGIDAPSPLKRRACFRVDPALLADLAPPEDAEPLSAPGWFPCFDHAALAADLAAGRARAVLAARDEPRDFETVIALYPDGRAYLWRQLRRPFRD